MFGYLDTQYIDFVAQQTEEHLASLQNRLGYNMADFIRTLDNGLAAVNQPDPLITALSYRTTADRISARSTGSRIFGRGAEYTVSRPQRGQRITGHMLPLYHNEMSMATTYRSMMTMDPETFRLEVQSTLLGVRYGQRADVLERLTSPVEMPLDDDGNGATPGFAGSGTGANEFKGRFRNGQPVPPGFTLYGYTKKDDLKEAIVTFTERLKLFHTGPFDMIGSPEAIDMVASLREDDFFVPTGSSLVRPAEDRAQALVSADRYKGVVNEIVRVHEGDFQIGGPNLVIFKTFGTNDPRNPLAWRYDPLFADGDVYVEDRDIFPLAQAYILQTAGVGVSDRAAAANILISDTATEYEPPVIERETA